MEDAGGGARRAAAGFSLLELLIVVAIMSAIALVAVLAPLGGSEALRLEAAAAEVAAALRFARSEAIRTGQPHGARLDTADERIRVFSLDTSSMPTTEDYSVVHPVDRRRYDVTLGSGAFEGSQIAQAQFLFAGDPSFHQGVAFTQRGVPVSPVDLSPLQTGSVLVSLGGESAVVSVDATTGRVSEP